MQSVRKLLLAAAMSLAAICAPAQSLVGNLVTTTSGQFSSGISAFVVFGTQALFEASGSFGSEPWITDGTPTGTHMLADLFPKGSSSPSDFVALGSVMLFAATVPGYGRELWRTDGTLAGTALVKDLWV